MVELISLLKTFFGEEERTRESNGEFTLAPMDFLAIGPIRVYVGTVRSTSCWLRPPVYNNTGFTFQNVRFTFQAVTPKALFAAASTCKI